MKRIEKSNWIKYFLALLTIEGVIALIGLTAIKSELANAFLFGLSKQRLLLLIIFTIIIFAIGVIAYKLWKYKNFKNKANLFVDQYLQSKRIYSLILTICFIGIIGLLLVINVFVMSTNTIFQSYYERIMPILWFFTCMFIEIMLFARFFKYGLIVKSFPKNTLTKFLFLFIIMVIIFGFVISTKIGLVPDEFQWRGPGVPLLAWQVMLSIILGFFLSKIGKFIINKFKKTDKVNWLTVSKLDLILMLVFWAGALFLWRSQDLHINYFNPGLNPPNYEFYPYSDASGFDISAYHLLIGNGFESDVHRPLLSAFLALGHGLFGYSYSAIVNWQLIFYSLLPALLYLLVIRLHNRVSAVMIASLAIFREIISIKLSGWLYVSNTKMIMSDFPTMLGIILIVYFVSKWLSSERKSGLRLFIAGGILGFTMLIRLQVVVIIFAIIVFILLSCKSQLKRFGISLANLMVGLMIVILPWLTRNYFVTGSFNFTDFSSSSQGGLIDIRYDLESLDGDGSSQPLVEKILEEPSNVANFVGAHFIHNQINSILVLPINSFFTENVNSFLNTIEYTNTPIKYFINMFSARNYAESMPYWPEWQDVYTPTLMIPMTANIMLVLFGISVAWRKNGLAGIFPVFVFFSYVLGLSIFRISGWRFLLPIDWVVYLYFGIGSIQLIYWIFGYFKGETIEITKVRYEKLNAGNTSHSRKQWASIVASFFFLSISIPIAEVVIPSRYSTENIQVILEEKAEEIFTQDTENGLDKFLKQSKAVVIQGLALYPRFDMAHEGHTGSQWESHVPQKYSRLGFLVVERVETKLQVILPIEEPPKDFLNGSDVIILACENEGYLIAQVVILGQKDEEEILFSSQLDWLCN